MMLPDYLRGCERVTGQLVLGTHPSIPWDFVPHDRSPVPAVFAPDSPFAEQTRNYTTYQGLRVIAYRVRQANGAPDKYVIWVLACRNCDGVGQWLEGSPPYYDDASFASCLTCGGDGEYVSGESAGS